MEPSSTPHLEYTQRLEARQRDVQRQARRYTTFARLRNIVLGAVVLLTLLGEKERTLVKVGLLALPALLFEAAMRGRNRAGRAWRRAERAADFYTQRLACLEDRWAGRGRSGLRFRDEPHPFAEDLDLFGTGSLFELLCTAQTALGEETLAGWLRTPAAADEVRARQGAVVALRARLDLREELLILGSEVPAGDLAALTLWSRSGEIPPTQQRLVLASGALTLGGAAACFLGAGPIPLLAALLVQASVSAWLWHLVQKTLTPVEELAPLLPPLARLLQRLQTARFSSPRLEQLRAALTGCESIPASGAASARRWIRAYRRADAAPLAGMLSQPLTPATGPVSGRLRSLGRLLVCSRLAILLLARPLAAVLIERWRFRRGQDLVLALAAVGEFEALASLAAHSFENPDDPFPEFVPAPCFDAEALGHPLLPRRKCVANDVRLTGELRVLAVSGSNMSGKSTLLRSVGVNAVLALAGAPVRARRLRLGLGAIGATLRIEDSLQAGRSRFQAEVLRVKELLDLAHTGPLLFLLDELFAGTSSQDRRAGAEAVVRTLLERGAIGLVTTHDLSLTEIAEHLAPRAANVHFRDEFAGGSLAFDHTLRPGVVPSSNGLVIMRALGIEV